MGERKRTLIGIAAGLAAMLLVPSRARGQHVRGHLTDEANGGPVPGAVVWLSDSTDKFLSRGVSRDSGLFELPRLLGSARVHVQRIGYRPKTVHIALTDSVVDIVLTPIALQLSATTARGRRVCPGDRGDTTGLELWTQARSALWASIIAREVVPPVIKLQSYTDQIDPYTKRLVEQKVETRQIVDDRSYVAARPAAQFAREGYMEEDRGGMRTYFAPDEAVMFDTSFVETHCLRAVSDDPAHVGEVGVAFEPIEANGRDTLVDIKGTLWIYTAKPRLSSIEFLYTGLEPAAKGAGGEVFFSTTPRGTAMVDNWQIRAVTLARDQRSYNGIVRRGILRQFRTEDYVIRNLTIGGQVVSATWSEHGELPYPRIVGNVSDTAHNPVAHARVWVYGGRDTVFTDAQGHFEMPRQLPGEVVVLASDSALASSGISRAIPRRLTTSGKGDFKVALEYHSRASTLASICPTLATRKYKGVVMARVVDEDDAPVPLAQVTIALDPRLQAMTPAGNTLHGETDETGNFTICGAVIGRVMSIRANKATAVGQAELTKWDDDFASLKIVVRR